MHAVSERREGRGQCRRHAGIVARRGARRADAEGPNA
jgi:hypothetical protein